MTAINITPEQQRLVLAEMYQKAAEFVRKGPEANDNVFRDNLKAHHREIGAFVAAYAGDGMTMGVDNR